MPVIEWGEAAMKWHLKFGWGKQGKYQISWLAFMVDM